MFRRIFGESKTKENEDTIRTINELQQSEQLMQKKIDKLNEQIDSVEDKARQCLKKANPDKHAAMEFLKRKKKYEIQRKKFYKIKENLESVNCQVQSSQLNRQITQSLHLGNKHLKQFEKTISFDKTEALIDEINETIDNLNETSDILARPIAERNDLIVSDVDLENELNQLNRQIVEDSLVKIDALPSAPSQPTTTTVEQQIKQLQRLIAE